MKIAVIGLGFVGLVTSTILADHGHDIIGIDIDKKKIDRLYKNDLYVYEPGLNDLFIKNKDNIKFSDNYDSIREADIAIICVPTPTINGKIDITYVKNAVESVNEINKATIIVIKSTVVPGTASALSKLINKNIVSNPEFLREGSAIYDTINPDRIVVGGKNKDDIETVSSIWEFTKAPVIKTTNENAELIKYVANSFLAVKISFINEISNLCEKIPDTDVNVIAKGIGLDHRIGKEFLKAGIGFGGSCFPKDTRAILAYAQEKSVDLSIIRSAINVNNDRINKSIELIEKTIGNFEDKKILLLGLSFKNDTNDLRESKAVELAKALTLKGSIVYAYDPIIKEYNGINVLKNLDNNKKYDCIIITSEWEDFKDNKIYKNNNVIDLRRIVDLSFYPNIKAIGVGYD